MYRVLNTTSLLLQIQSSDVTDYKLYLAIVLLLKETVFLFFDLIDIVHANELSFTPTIAYRNMTSLITVWMMVVRFCVLFSAWRKDMNCECV